MDPHPEGMREIERCHIQMFSHPFRMRSSFSKVPGVYAALQPLATFSNPFGVYLLNSMPLPFQGKELVIHAPTININYINYSQLEAA
jgi:hypothetical protein